MFTLCMCREILHRCVMIWRNVCTKLRSFYQGAPPCVCVCVCMCVCVCVCLCVCICCRDKKDAASGVSLKEAVISVTFLVYVLRKKYAERKGQIQNMCVFLLVPAVQSNTTTVCVCIFVCVCVCVCTSVLL